MSSSLDCLDLCRLCLIKDRVSVPIFEDEGDVRQIFLKITACLPVKVSRDDKLPKKICDDCVYKVELFYQFWNTTANAEKQLLQWLGEVDLEDKQTYVTEVLDTNVMKQEQNSDNRLEGNVIQVSGHQNNMDIGMIEDMTIMTIPAGSEQQFTTVPMDTSGTVQTVQAVPGPSTHDQMGQSQTHLVTEEVEESEEEENSDDGCDNEEGLPVKEETEEVQTETFVNVPISCDEAGPSGLQQQKVTEMSEMSMTQTATDGDPKTGRKRTRTRVPTILQRKRNVNAVNNITEQQNEVTKPATFILTNQSNIQSVLKNFHHDILVNSYDQSLERKPASITIFTSKNVSGISQNDKQEKTLKSSKPETQSINEPEMFRCDSCDESFNDRSSWIIHKTEKSIIRTRAALREPIVKYRCDICKRLFATKGIFARHQKVCGIVELNFPSSNYHKRPAKPRIQRKNKVTGEEDPSVCEKCNKVFKKYKCLKVHMTMAHGEDITCQVCDVKLDSIALLKEHMANLHSGDFTDFCPICNKGFYLRKSLKIHMTAHRRDDKPCVCNQCGKHFRHDVYLQKHIQLVHIEMRVPKKYHCQECDYETLYKTCFKEHMYKHTGEDKVKCDVCGKHMRKDYYMRIHSRIHTGEKPYVCEYCGKGFTAKKYLVKHLVTHTGEKPYQCQVCGKKYTQRGTLTLHFKKHHPHEMYNTKRGSRRFIDEINVEIKETNEGIAVKSENMIEQVIENDIEDNVEVSEDGAIVVIGNEDEVDENEIGMLKEDDEIIEEGEIVEDDIEILEEDLEDQQDELINVSKDSIT